MRIQFDSSKNKFSLTINETVYGYYLTAVSAADDVYTHTTGCYDWDCLDGTLSTVPTDIYQWIQM